MPPIPRRRRRPVAWYARWVLVAVSALSLGYVAYSFADAEVFQAYGNWNFNRSSKASAATVQPKRMMTVSSEPVAVSHVDVAAGSVLGRLEISRIGISVIVAEGVDSRTLRRAVGHIPGTAFPGETGNVAISGHRDTFFRPLKDIQPDDEITLTTIEGTYRYRVDSLKVVAENDVSVLDESSESLLTLVTCYPFYYVGPAPKRFIVRAHRF